MTNLQTAFQWGAGNLVWQKEDEFYNFTHICVMVFIPPLQWKSQTLREGMCYSLLGRDSCVWLQVGSWQRRSLVSSPSAGCVEFSVLWQWTLEHNCIFKNFYLFWKWGTSGLCASNSLLPNNLLLLPWQTCVLNAGPSSGFAVSYSFLVYSAATRQRACFTLPSQLQTK